MSEIGSRYVSIYPRVVAGFSTEINAAVQKGAAQGGVLGGKAASDGLSKVFKSSVPAAIGDGLEKGVQQAAPRVGSVFKSAVAPILALGAVSAVTSFVKTSVDAFNTFQDASSAAAVTFGDSIGKVTTITDNAAKTMGMSKTAAIDAATGFGTYAKAAGLAGDDAANFSTQMVQLAADLASFKGTSPEQAIDAIGAAFRGENDPLEQYQVLLQDATLRQRALTLGIIDNVKNALTPQQRILAAQAEILAQTTTQQGDYNRTATQGGNVQKTLAAESASLAVDIGEKLQPAIIAAQQAGIGMIDWAIQNQEALLPLAKTVGAVTAAVGGFLVVSKGVEAVRAARNLVNGLGEAFTQMGTKAKVATVSAGAIGVALTAAAVVYGAFAQQNADAKQAVDDFTQALKDDNGVLGENVRLRAVKSLTDAGALQAAKALGLGVDTVTDAALGNADAMKLVNERLAESDSHWSSAASATTDEAKATGTLRTALGETSEAIAKSKDALETQNTAMRSGVAATNTITTATSSAKVSFDDYKKAIDGVYNAQLKLRGDERAVEAAIDGAADSIEKYKQALVKKYEHQGKSKTAAEAMAEADIKAGKALDVNTKAGRDNQAALDSIADTAFAAAAGMTDTEKASGKAGEVMDRARDRFVDTAKKMGLSATAAQRLADKLGLIKSKKITVTAEVKPVIVGSSQIVLQQTNHGTIKMGLLAGGGAVHGGIPGKDSVPSLLMPDEHVLTTEDVRNLGGHAGVYRMRAAAKSGLLHFAGGGPVAPTYNGHSLDYWQDYLLSDLEYTQLLISIRDAKASLAEKETYNPPGKRKKATRLKLRGLDRAEAEQQLKEYEAKLKLADEARKADASRAGTLAKQIADYEAQRDAYDEAQEAAQKAADDAKSALGQKIGSAYDSAASVWSSSLAKSAGLGSLDAISTRRTNAVGDIWYVKRNLTADDLAARINNNADQVETFINLLDQLRKSGASEALISDVQALGAVDGTTAAKLYLSNNTARASAEAGYSRLAAAQASLNSIAAAAGAQAAVQVTINEAATPEATKQAVINGILAGRS